MLNTAEEKEFFSWCHDSDTDSRADSDTAEMFHMQPADGARLESEDDS